MALVNCNECGNQVSTTASACPKCGAPVASGTTPNTVSESPKKKQSTLVTVGSGFLIVFALGILWTVWQDYQAQVKAEAEVARIQALPEMPIEVKYREALIGSGLVASFKNTSTKHLAVVASMENPSLHQSKIFRLDLAPNQVAEIGHMEGWTFASGDLILITHNDFRPMTVSIP